MKPIYFDHSATTPTDPRVVKAMTPFFTKVFGNPSSIHGFGQAALQGVDDARSAVAAYLHADPDEVVFTSGATESNNLAIKGLFKSLRAKEKGKLKFITSLVEHDAVLEPGMELEKEGVEVVHLPVDKRGVIRLADLERELDESTALVSIMWVNSEVGAVMPVREAGKLVRKFNEKRVKEWEKRGPKERGEKPRPVYFHTDATQALNFYNCDVDWNYIDLLSLSAHKIYGPKGVGALYVRQGTPVSALQRGGHQEKNLRSGTYNSAAIVGLGAAVGLLGIGEKGEPSKAQMKMNKGIARLRDYLVAGVMKRVPDTVYNTPRDPGTPAHAHFSFPGAEGESVLIALDLAGIAVSTGSACASGSLKASHVLLAMGIPTEICHTSIRITLGRHTTKFEIDRFLKVLPSIIARMRKMNPLYHKA